MRTNLLGPKCRPGVGMISAVIACVLAIGSVAGQELRGWNIERNGDPPTYAVIRPSTTTINVDSLVLVCGDVGERSILQFELYPTNELPLTLPGVDQSDLREDPRVQLSIDGRIVPVSLYFAEDRVIVADTAIGMAPALSEHLLDLTAMGETLRMRFNLLAKPPGTQPEFDGEVTFDLQAGLGGAAVTAVRRCASEIDPQISQR